METVLAFETNKLIQYKERCFDCLLGVLRPDYERLEILIRIETILEELKRREDGGVIPCGTTCSCVRDTNCSDMCILQLSERLDKGVQAKD